MAQKKKITRKKVAKKKATNAKAKPKAKSNPKAKKKTYTHHPDHYNTSEAYLVQNLEEDLKDAWFNLREFGASLGEQRIYASGRAIMFSRKVCYFFVRPKKTYLEVVIFLQKKRSPEIFKSIRPATKTKIAHTFRLVHSDQIEGEFADAIRAAYDETPSV